MNTTQSLKTFKLNNGVEMPSLGLGTFLMEDAVTQAVVKKR